MRARLGLLRRLRWGWHHGATAALLAPHGPHMLPWPARCARTAQWGGRCSDQDAAGMPAYSGAPFMADARHPRPASRPAAQAPTLPNNQGQTPRTSRSLWTRYRPRSPEAGQPPRRSRSTPLQATVCSPPAEYMLWGGARQQQRSRHVVNSCRSFPVHHSRILHRRWQASHPTDVCLGLHIRAVVDQQAHDLRAAS